MHDEVARISRNEDVPDCVIGRHIVRARVVQVAQQPSYAVDSGLRAGSLERHGQLALDVLHDMPTLLIEAQRLGCPLIADAVQVREEVMNRG